MTTDIDTNTNTNTDVDIDTGSAAEIIKEDEIIQDDEIIQEDNFIQDNLIQDNLIYQHSSTQSNAAQYPPISNATSTGTLLSAMLQNSYRILSNAEEAELGKQIEVYQYIDHIIESVNPLSPNPVAVDVFIELIERLILGYPLMKMLLSSSSLLGNIFTDNPPDFVLSKMISALDIDNHINKSLAQNTPYTVEAIIELYILYKAIPWQSIHCTDFDDLEQSFMQLRNSANHEIITNKISLNLDILEDHFNSIITTGKQSEETLIRAHFRLCISVAKRYTSYGMEFSDILQQGNIGLIRAARKFNPHFGYRFSTYSTWWITQAISRSIMEQNSLIKIPIHMIQSVAKIKKCNDSNANTNIDNSDNSKNISGKPHLSRTYTTLDGISKTMDESQYKAYSIMSSRTLSLDQKLPGSDEDSDNFGDMEPDQSCLNPEDEAISSSLHSSIMKAVDSLPLIERTVITMRFGLEDGCNHTLEDIGKHIHKTRERVRQIQLSAIRHLRPIVTKLNLKEYLDLDG